MVMAPKWAGLPIGEALVFEHGGGNVALTTALKLILKADPYRVAVTFTGYGGGEIYFSVNDASGFEASITGTASNVPFTINDDMHPGLAGQAWYAKSSTGSNNLTYIYTRLVE